MLMGLAVRICSTDLQTARMIECLLMLSTLENHGLSAFRVWNASAWPI